MDCSTASWAWVKAWGLFSTDILKSRKMINQNTLGISTNKHATRIWNYQTMKRWPKHPRIRIEPAERLLAFWVLGRDCKNNELAKHPRMAMKSMINDIWYDITHGFQYPSHFHLPIQWQISLSWPSNEMWVASGVVARQLSEQWLSKVRWALLNRI